MGAPEARAMSSRWGPRLAKADARPFQVRSLLQTPMSWGCRPRQTAQIESCGYVPEFGVPPLDRFLGERSLSSHDGDDGLVRDPLREWCAS